MSRDRAVGVLGASVLVAVSIGVLVFAQGPASSAAPNGPGRSEAAHGVPFDETLPALAASFPRAVGASSVAGVLWMPADETDVVVLGVGVAGGCGGQELLGPRDVPGHSMARRVAATGRAFVSVDVPGTNESAAPPGERGGEGAARAAKAVEDALRAGTYAVEKGGNAPAFQRVVGFGQSCGAAGAGADSPAKAAALRRITVPVSIVLGPEERRVTVPSDAEEWNSDDLSTVVVRDTGHVMLMHTSFPATMRIVTAWLMERGL